MVHIVRSLPDGHQLANHLGHDLLERAYMSIDWGQTEDAFAQLRDAMMAFGWDSYGKRLDGSESRRCWRAWVGMAARDRVRSLDQIEDGPYADTTTEQAVLNDLEELYFEIKYARLREIGSM